MTSHGPLQLRKKKHPSALPVADLKKTDMEKNVHINFKLKAEQIIQAHAHMSVCVCVCWANNETKRAMNVVHIHYFLLFLSNVIYYIIELILHTQSTPQTT